MYIIKNAFRSISRSKGRNILIGIIIFVIAFSSCIGLSIRQAAESAKEDTLAGLQITASISVDRRAMMENMMNKPEEGTESSEEGSEQASSFDPSEFKDKMQEVSDLTIEEMKEYAKAESVAEFQYTTSVSINGSDEFSPVDSSTEDSEETESTEESNTPPGNLGGNMPGGMGNQEEERKGFLKGNMGSQGDFTLVGYSAYSAMSDFVSGSCSISEGSLFEEGESDGNCVITDELALFNNLSVGDEITLTNPNDEEETHTLTISGIYSNSQSTVSSSDRMGGFSTSSDPANRILVSEETIQDLLAASEEQAETTTDENTGMTRTTALPSQNSGTYVFASVEDYEKFEDEVREMGLSENYSITSEDVSGYEESLVPLENLSNMATKFLLVILIIGAIVLVVLNIFNIRERKYEVGVLTAIGMKKRKVATQFMIEIFVLTFVAVLFGGVAGAVSSVPVTNSLLESQIAAKEASADTMDANFGKETNMSQGMRDNVNFKNQGGMPGGMEAFFGPDSKSAEYISEVSSAANLTVFLQLIAVGMGLALVAGGASVIFIMRYEPLKILANRD